MSEPESPQGEWGTSRVGRPAAPSGGTCTGVAAAGRSEERAQSEPEMLRGERGARRTGRLALAAAGRYKERA